MNRVLIHSSDEIEGGRFCIPNDQRLKHICSVLRVEAGDTLKVCLPDKGIGLARVEKIWESGCELLLLSLCPGLEAGVQIIVGVSRPPTVRKILEHGTCQGVRSFHFLQSDLSEKSYLQSRVFQEAETKKHIDLGLSQSSVYFRRPEVNLHQRFQTLEKLLTNTSPVADRVLLEPKSNHSLATLDLGTCKNLILSVGPERGYSSREVEWFLDQGFKTARISPSILRVEWAVMAALAQLDLIWMK
jgi:16S rRNA (uracil1498-N3)-methyltransferase